MRFISKTPNYQVTAIKGRERKGLGPDGVLHTDMIEPAYIAQFTPHGLSPWELDMAREKWAGEVRRKMPRDGRIENYFGVFDTDLMQALDKEEMWDEEFKEKVEQGLLKRCHATKMLQVERPLLAIPWPAYDKIGSGDEDTDDMAAVLIVETALMIGADLDHIVLYETETQKRQTVIDAVRAALQSDDVPTDAIKVPA